MSLHTEFDKGSLIWVKSEIEETFGRAKEALQRYAAGNDDAALKHAQTHLHQAYGALTLVDLAGLARFCEEIELAAAHLARTDAGKDGVPALLHAIESAGVYLERLMAGMSNTPLLLHPVFKEIAALRGGSHSGAELFFPQLQLDLPVGLPQRKLAAEELAPFIRQQRSRFESGLLRWLQGQKNASQALAASLAEVATYQQIEVVRAFWWTAAALALGSASNKATIDLDSRQLFLRLNLQLRRLSDGSGKVAERLFRDMLYMLAKMDCESNLVRRLQKSFQLSSLIPSAEVMAMGVEQRDLQVARALREDLRVVKDAWSRIAGGQHDRLNQFPQQLAGLAKKTIPLAAPALDRLWKGLAEALGRYGAKGPSEVDSLEFATGLLLADNALAVYPDLSSDYAAQVDALLLRLINPASAVNLPQLDSVSREAQERLLMAQIAQEIRVNLQSIEEMLDTYFRDPSNASTLPGLVGPLRQVQGALLMLDRPRAVQILQECQKRVDGFMAGHTPELPELEDLAEALSMLGFYIDDLEQGREKEETLQPALVRLCGVVEETVAAPVMEEILEAEPELVVPGQAAPVSEPQPEPEPVPENKPLPVSDAAIDAELLEVYLEEAVEVLAAIDEQLTVSREDPYDREAATLIRRSFHTLKGSGRMVGLFNLGEVAWAIEQVFNKLLQVEKPASPALLELVGQSHAAFSGWVGELQRHGTVEVEASGLISRAAALRDGLDSEPEPEPEPPVGANREQITHEEVAEVEKTDEVNVGDVNVSSTLFAIFQEEAERHVTALKLGLAALAERGQLEQSFILAAHTLGGIASTTGFRRQGELAYALEHALQLLGLDAKREVQLLSEAVDSLDNMLAEISRREAPHSATALITRLNDLRAEVPELVLNEENTVIALDLDEPDALASDTLTDVTAPAAAQEIIVDELAGEVLPESSIEEVIDAVVLPDTSFAASITDEALEEKSAEDTAKEQILELDEYFLSLEDQPAEAQPLSAAAEPADLVAELEVLALGPVEDSLEDQPAGTVSEPVFEAALLPDAGFEGDEALDLTGEEPESLALTEAALPELAPELFAESVPGELTPEAELGEVIALDLGVEEPEPLEPGLSVQSAAFLTEPVPETFIAESTDATEFDLTLEEPVLLDLNNADLTEQEATALLEPVPEAITSEAIPADNAEPDLTLEEFISLDLNEELPPEQAETVSMESLAGELVAPMPEIEKEATALLEPVLETISSEAIPANNAEPDLTVEELISLDLSEEISPEQAEAVSSESLVEDLVAQMPAIENTAEFAESDEVLLAASTPESALELPVQTTPVDQEIAVELETLSVAADMADDAAEEKESLAVRKADVDSSFIDDIDEQLLPVFVEEADELMPQISAQLYALADGDGVEALNRLKRTLHTMKGSARMSGAMRMGEAAHRMETRMEGVTHPSEALRNQLDNDYDLLQILFDEVSGRSVPTPIVVADEVAAAVLPAGVTTITPAQAPRILALAEPEGKATIRVKSDLVDELVNQAGEVSIARSRIEAEMLGLKGSLSDLTENVARLRSQLREIEIQAESQMQAREKELQEHETHFDPLEFDRFTRLQELTRFLAESVNDVGNVQQTLLKNLDESNAALLAQGRMTRDLQQSLMRVRLVPFNSVSERLYRLARTTGKEVGKKVNLELKGGSVEIDRGVLEKMASPFEHMLRNAIDHGLEDTATRLAAGKPEFGEILIEARQEGNELVLLLKDDGRGLDLTRIRAKAIEKGLIQPDQQLSEHELSMLIFEPGFSTASNVTQLSGRGIGMDVVKNEISNLGGRIDLSSTLGEGTSFIIRLPLTLAVTQVLLVRAGDRTIAIPSALVEQVQELKHEALAELYAKREQLWMGKHYKFAYLPRLLGDLYRQPEQKRYSMVLLLRSGAERIALHIDDLVKNLEVVVKQVGPQLARVPGVVGGTVLGSGEIVLIMNPLFLLPMMDQIAAAVDPAQQTLSIAAQEKVEALQTTPVVMVVDDSLTVRKITGRLLAREGFQVVSAKDGVDALQQLQDVRPAVMLVDIEMPRMDGFELTRNVRAAPDTRDIPIIMITSRTADKHRNVAFDLGVNVFLGKPYQEDELLEHIRKFIDVD